MADPLRSIFVLSHEPMGWLERALIGVAQVTLGSELPVEAPDLIVYNLPPEGIPALQAEALERWGALPALGYQARAEAAGRAALLALGLRDVGTRLDLVSLCLQHLPSRAPVRSTSAAGFRLPGTRQVVEAPPVQVEAPAVQMDDPNGAVAGYFRTLSDYQALRVSLSERLGPEGLRELQKLLVQRERTIEALSGPLFPDGFGVRAKDRSTLGWNVQLRVGADDLRAVLQTAAADGLSLQLLAAPPAQLRRATLRLGLSTEGRPANRVEAEIEVKWVRRLAVDTWQVGASWLGVRVNEGA